MPEVQDYKDYSWKPRYNPWVIALTVTLATFMEVLDTSIANVALPHIAGGLRRQPGRIHLGADQLPGFQRHRAAHVGLAHHGHRAQALLHDLRRAVHHLIRSLRICAVARDADLLPHSAGRGRRRHGPQRAGDSRRHVSAEKRGMAFAVYGMAVVVAPAIGPTLGGWITDNYDWRWIFFINVPVGLLSLFLTSTVVEDPPWLKRFKSAAA